MFSDKSVRKIHKENNIARSTITTWYSNFKENINIFVRKKRDITTYKHIFKDQIFLIIKEELDKNSRITLSNMKFLIYKKINVNISLKMISKILKCMNFSRKKIKNYEVKNKEKIDEISLDRKKFIEKMNEIDISRIISIDESSLRNLNDNYFGYSEKGKQIHHPVKRIRKYYGTSLLMGITSEKVIHHKIYTKTINSDDFNNFIKEIIKLLEEKGKIFIFDNCSIHKKKEMLKMIEDEGHYYMFIPPYSPNLNPIENVFGILKKMIKNIMKETIDVKELEISILLKKGIEMFDKKYKESLKKIFIRAFTFDYTDIEKELKNRIIFT